MPFSPQTIDFLTMNRLNDSKTWFNEHKDDYRRFVAEPFREFTEKLLPEMQKIDPLINSDDFGTRVMAVVDFISGMTDIFALDIYQKIQGISLPIV